MFELNGKTLVIAAAIAGGSQLAAHQAQAVTLASWDEWADNTTAYDADDTLTGFTATIASATDRAIDGFGSTDGTFGTESGATNETTPRGVLVRVNGGNSVLTIVINNDTGADYSIDSFHFDFGPRQDLQGNLSFDSYTLTYISGGLGSANTQIADVADVTRLAAGVGSGDLPDQDINLAPALSDVILGDGESATFELAFTGNSAGNGESNSAVVDNVAFQGTLIPEPASLALVGLGGLLMLGRSRRTA